MQGMKEYVLYDFIIRSSKAKWILGVQTQGRAMVTTEGESRDLVIGLGASCTRAHLVKLPPARYTSHLYALLQVNTGGKRGERQRLYRGKTGLLQRSVWVVSYFFL